MDKQLAAATTIPAEVRDIEMEDFISWFQSKNGTVDTTVMTIADIPGQGRGALALKDIPKGHTLFTIPRDVTLSTRTSALPQLLGSVEWKRFKLDEGWAGLILCMLWEEAQGPLSKWAEYLSILPTEFDTPMFWSEEELQELKGTSVVDKIGKEEAERDYYEKIVPTVQSRAELFPPDTVSAHYTLDNYHRMGSRILSRSFTVSRWTGEAVEEEIEGSSQSTGSMEVDDKKSSLPSSEANAAELSEDEDEEDADDPSDVAMVPMADMLNAQYESENSKLFYEEHDLKMITTKDIKGGEQIYNTYGDPPNSDLLRRYGHVDLVPLRPPLSGEGNPEDIVEIRGDLVVEAAAKRVSVDAGERVEWWLENAEDEYVLISSAKTSLVSYVRSTFVIGTECEVPKDFISFTRLLLQTQSEWEKTRAKDKVPKATLDTDVTSVLMEVLDKRLSEYPTTIEADEKTLVEDDPPFRKRNAIIVRLGEKRILQTTRSELEKSHEALHNTKGEKNKLLPLIFTFALVGIVQSPQLVHFIQTRIPTLDVFKLFTIDEAPVPEYWEEVETSINVLNTLLDIFWDGSKPRPVPLGAVAVLFTLTLLLYGIRKNVAEAQLNSGPEYVQVFFEPSVANATISTSTGDLQDLQSPSHSFLKSILSGPVEVSAEEIDTLIVELGSVYEPETSDDGDIEDEEEFDDGYESERTTFSARGLLNSLIPSTPSLPRMLDMVLWRPGRPQQAEHTPEPNEEHSKKKARRAGRRFSRARHRRRMEAWTSDMENEEIERMLDPMPLEKPPVSPSPSRKFPLLLGSSGTLGVAIEPLPSTPPRTPQPGELACPTWPPEAPSPSNLPKLYPSLSTASDVKAESSSPVISVKQEQAPTITPPFPPLEPVPDPKVPTSPQNWRTRRGRPIITEGGFRMIRHYLGISKKSTPKNNQTPRVAIPLQDIKPTVRTPVKDETSDKTLVEPSGSILSKMTPAKSARAKQLATVKKGEKRKVAPTCPTRETEIIFTEEETPVELFPRVAVNTRRGLGLEEKLIVYNPRA
ncbi:hypothetical protein NM688_g2462 [Phlebia brevispora]|uniref:Uncharacterized protein n=1 Tax=Phlebia brevispora TaxID=194682 RepID=A0ACC1T8J9_9APHY|nr:hypothetical protein NM688_g2462 [Phlebia brevispora]